MSHSPPTRRRPPIEHREDHRDRADETSTAVGSGDVEPPAVAASTSFEDQERAVGIDPDAPLPGEQGLR